jgi:ATP-binding protein involved in chromosome partitioning
MGMARMLPRAEMIVVTTPATGAQKVAARAVSMARKSHLRVAGVIENMSVFINEVGTRYELFGSGGGAKLAAMAGVELLGQIPIEADVSLGGDTGQPVALGQSEAARVFADIAGQIVKVVSPPVEMASCSARLFELIDAAFDEADGADGAVQT